MGNYKFPALESLTTSKLGVFGIMVVIPILSDAPPEVKSKVGKLDRTVISILSFRLHRPRLWPTLLLISHCME